GLLDTIRAIQPPGKWKIVVVDAKSYQILSAACKMDDILEMNVSRKVLLCTSSNPDRS
ncbi:hypothetical protein BDF14DRAFT_1726596, partial [Spinellus fusiger]